LLSRDVEFFGVIFGRSQKLLNHKIGVRVAEPEVVISRHSNSVVMYPNGSITVVAMDIYTLAMGTLSYVLAGVVAFHINVCIESYNYFENGMW